MSYYPPDVYLEQQGAAGGAAAGGSNVPVVIGKASTTKRYWAEAVVRGAITAEALTMVAGVAALTYTSNEKQADAVLYKNGAALPASAWSFTTAAEVTVALAYRDDAATWTMDYIQISGFRDSLTATPPASTDVKFVAKGQSGGAPYAIGTDWTLVVDEIDWSSLTAATITGEDQTYDLSVNSKIKISVDGLTPITITLTGSVPAAVTAAEVISAINSATNGAWGAAYNAVASTAGTGFKLTSPTVGASSTINFYVPASDDATAILFAAITAPTYVKGAGVRPAPGTTYFVRYDAARPAADYDTVRMFYSYDEAKAAIGPMNADNELLRAIEKVFKGGARQCGAIQVRDLDGDGIYMYNDWTRAIDALKDDSVTTDVLLAEHDTDVMSYLVSVIESEADLTVGHLLGGWFGHAYGATPGTPDTPGTIAYTAWRLLQVAADSQGRGRFHFITYGDGTPTDQVTDGDTGVTSDVNAPSWLVAASILGSYTALSPISESLLRDQVVGFQASGFTMKKALASFLTQYGCWCVYNDGGRLVNFDPVTTDAGGDTLYVEPNIRPQKDYVARRIRQRLNQYVIGVVPDSPADFVAEAKNHIGVELEAAIEAGIISPYLDANGRQRPLDPASDIIVAQSQSNKTEYRFQYWIQAKWPVKRMFGVYTVDLALI